MFQQIRNRMNHSYFLHEHRLQQRIPAPDMQASSIYNLGLISTRDSELPAMFALIAVYTVRFPVLMRPSCLGALGSIRRTIQCAKSVIAACKPTSFLPEGLL